MDSISEDLRKQEFERHGPGAIPEHKPRTERPHYTPSYAAQQQKPAEPFILPWPLKWGFAFVLIYMGYSHWLPPAGKSFFNSLFSFLSH